MWKFKVKVIEPRPFDFRLSTFDQKKDSNDERQTSNDKRGAFSERIRSTFDIRHSTIKQSKMSFFKRIFSSEKKQTLDKGLEQTKTSFFSKLTKAVAGKSKVDDEVLDNLEEVLVASDVGVETTLKIIKRIEKRVADDKYLGTDELNKILHEEIAALLSETNTGEATDFKIPTTSKPYVIMVVGVNGVGKTTTIGKLAS